MLFALSLLLPLAIYAALARRLIQTGVGYQMDEALYVESAVFMLRDGSGTPPFVHEPAAWITLFGRRWPLMIIPYVGTVKAFTALPLFAAFGISAETARFAGVLLGGLGIAGLVALIGTQASPAAGLITGLLLAIHPSYLAFTVFDNGGVSVWMGAMGLAALALVNHVARRSTASAFLLGIAAGLGVWARANFSWLLLAFAAAALLAGGRRALPGKRQVAAAAAGGLLGAMPLLVYEAASRLATLRFIAETARPLSGHVIVQRLRGLIELMVSDSEQRRIWSGPPLPDWQWSVGAVLLTGVALSLIVPSGRGKPAISRWRQQLALSAILLTVILISSRLHIAQHHLVAVQPLALASLAILAVEVAPRYRRAVPVLMAAATGLAVLSLSWNLRTERGLRETGGRWTFSSGIYEVSRHLESHPVPPGRLKILDWGFQNNLYVISGGAVHGNELFWGATKEASSRGFTWDAELADGGTFLLFQFPTRPSPITFASEGFSKALESYRGPRREQLFVDRLGSPFARLVKVTPAR